MAPDSTARTHLDVACHINALLPDADPRDLPAALRSLAELGYSRIVLPPLDPATTDADALARVLAEHAIAPDHDRGRSGAGSGRVGRKTPKSARPAQRCCGASST